MSDKKKQYWVDDYGTVHEFEVSADAVHYSVGALCPVCHPNQQPPFSESNRRLISAIDRTARRFDCVTPNGHKQQHDQPTKTFRIKPRVTLEVLND